MKNHRWHVEREGTELTLCRPGRRRFDVRASVQLSHDAPLSRYRIAHQIRQDIWRALSRVRGFSPIVHVRREGAGCTIVAGGMLSDRNIPYTQISARLANVLENPKNQARWCRFAQARRVEGRVGHVGD